MMLDVDELIEDYGYIDNIDDFIKAVDEDTNSEFHIQIINFINNIVYNGRVNGDLCCGMDIIDTLKEDIKYRQDNNLLSTEELQEDIDDMLAFSAKGYNDTTYIFDNDCTIEDEPNDMKELLEYYKEYGV